MEYSKDQKTIRVFKMTGDWKEQSRQLKTRYPLLTDEDLKYEKGKENDLLKRVQSRLHKNRDEVANIIRKVQPVSL